LSRAHLALTVNVTPSRGAVSGGRPNRMTFSTTPAPSSPTRLKRCRTSPTTTGGGAMPANAVGTKRAPSKPTIGMTSGAVV
jgi:hypothetical protein